MFFWGANEEGSLYVGKKKNGGNEKRKKVKKGGEKKEVKKVWKKGNRTEKKGFHRTKVGEGGEIRKLKWKFISLPQQLYI